MTTPPTDRPLTAGDVPLLREGDVLRDYAGRTCVFDHMVRDDYLWAGIGDGSSTGAGIGSFTFVRRPASDDWIEWHGGENPAGDAVVEIKLRNHCTSVEVAAEINWSHGFDNPESRACDITHYRLSRPATSAASDAEGVVVSNQTHEWRAVTAALSGYRVVQAPYLNALSSADIIGLALAILRVHPPVQTDSAMQAMARSAEFRAIAAEQELAALASPPVSERERELEGAVARFLAVNDEFDRRASLGMAGYIPALAGVKEKSAADLRTEGQQAVSDMRRLLTAQPAGEGK